MLKLIAFCIIFVGIAQAHRHRGGRGGWRYQNDPLVCNKHYLINATLCVTLPEIFSADLFVQCNNELSNSVTTQRLSRRRGRSAHRGRNGRYGISSRGWSGRGGRHSDRYCAGQCVLNKTNNLLSNGSIDIDAVRSNYENKANEAWKPIVTQAVNDCWTNISSQLAALDAQPGRNGVSKCSKGPMLLIICIQRYNFLNTPDNQKVNLVPNGQDNCTVRDNQLANCNPLYLPNCGGWGSGTGNGGWNRQQNNNNEFASGGNPNDVDIIDM